MARHPSSDEVRQDTGAESSEPVLAHRDALVAPEDAPRGPDAFGDIGTNERMGSGGTDPESNGAPNGRSVLPPKRPPLLSRPLARRTIPGRRPGSDPSGADQAADATVSDPSDARPASAVGNRPRFKLPAVQRPPRSRPTTALISYGTAERDSPEMDWDRIQHATLSHPAAARGREDEPEILADAPPGASNAEQGDPDPVAVTPAVAGEEASAADGEGLATEQKSVRPTRPPQRKRVPASPRPPQQRPAAAKKAAGAHPVSADPVADPSVDQQPLDPTAAPDAGEPKRAERRPVQRKPVQRKPVERPSADQAAAEPGAGESKPAQRRPVQRKPVERPSADDAAADPSAVERKPVQRRPPQRRLADDAAADTGAVERKPVQRKPPQRKPVERPSADQATTEPGAVERKPAPRTPVERKPVQTGPEAGTPIDDAIAGAGSVDGASASPVVQEPSGQHAVPASPAKRAPVQRKPVDRKPAERVERQSGTGVPAEREPVQRTSPAPRRQAPSEAAPAAVKSGITDPVTTGTVAADPATTGTVASDRATTGTVASDPATTGTVGRGPKTRAGSSAVRSTTRDSATVEPQTIEPTSAHTTSAEPSTAEAGPSAEHAEFELRPATPLRPPQKISSKSPARQPKPAAEALGIAGPITDTRPVQPSKPSPTGLHGPGQYGATERRPAAPPPRSRRLLAPVLTATILTVLGALGAVGFIEAQQQDVVVPVAPPYPRDARPLPDPAPADAPDLSIPADSAPQTGP